MQERPLKHMIENEIGVQDSEKKQEQQDVECCQTKIWLWDQDQYEEFQSDYLNQIFPYKINKNTMTPGAKFIFHFLSSSMHYWIELIQEKEKQQGKLGLKDAKFIKQILQEDQTENWIAFRRWGKNFLTKQQFLEQQAKENTWKAPSGGEIIHTYKREDTQFEVIRYYGDNQQFNQFKQRMEVMFLFYIDGVSFITEQIKTWVYFVVFKKLENRNVFVGALSEYNFKISTNKQRHRISQVFILPNYQKYGHGKQLLDIVYNISLNDSKCFEITTQIPSFEYQCLRDYKQAEMIVDNKLLEVSQSTVPKSGDQIKRARDKILSEDVLKSIKTQLKLPGHQIERIAHIFVFERILRANDDMAKAHFEQYLRQKIIFNRSPFKSRQKLPHITFYGQSPEMKQFYLQKAKQDFLRNQGQIQELLTETIEGYNRVINKLRKMKKI